MGPFEFLILVAAIGGLVVCLLPRVRRRRGAKALAAVLGLVALAVAVGSVAFADRRPRVRVFNGTPEPIELEVRRGDGRRRAAGRPIPGSSLVYFDPPPEGVRIASAGRVMPGSSRVVFFDPPPGNVRIAFRRPRWAKAQEMEAEVDMVPGGPFGTSYTLVVWPDHCYLRSKPAVLDPFLPIR